MRRVQCESCTSSEEARVDQSGITFPMGWAVRLYRLSASGDADKWRLALVYLCAKCTSKEGLCVERAQTMAVGASDKGLVLK